MSMALRGGTTAVNAVEPINVYDCDRDCDWDSKTRKSDTEVESKRSPEGSTAGSNEATKLPSLRKNRAHKEGQTPEREASQQGPSAKLNLALSVVFQTARLVKNHLSCPCFFF